MPKRKVVSNLSGFVDSDEEDPMQSEPGNTATHSHRSSGDRPVKKARGRPKGLNSSSENSSSVPSPPAVSVKGPTKEDTGVIKTTRRGRPAKNNAINENVHGGKNRSEIVTKISSNSEAPYDQSADEERENQTISSPKVDKVRSKAVKKDMTVVGDGDFEFTPTSRRQAAQQGAKAPIGGRGRGGSRSVNEEIDGIGMSESEFLCLEAEKSVLENDRSVGLRAESQSPHKVRVNSQLRQSQDGNRKRITGLPKEEERGPSDSTLRRKLGEITKKYESLESKYKNLKEVGVVEASANVERFRKQCEITTAASNKLVASLKEELAAQTALAQQTRGLQKKLKDSEAQVKTLNSEVEDLSSQLSRAHTDIKALQTKLAAARNAVANSDGIPSKGAGSAVKTSGVNRSLNGNPEVAQAAQLAQLKEDLYSDLTGLIILDVKKQESNHVYDCIQTGVNGTLHFKLAVSHEGDSKTTSSFDSAEFHYTPLLDANRDSKLIELLPDYLTVDISFSRQQASKFYTRVIDKLTKRPIEADD